MANQHIFNYFRRQLRTQEKTVASQKIFFQLSFDDHGAFIAVVDKKGKAVEANYLSYSGATRTVLQSLEQVQLKHSFLIDWERPTDRIYLMDYDSLLAQIRDCDNLVDEQLKPLHFSNKQGQVNLLLSTVPKEANAPSSQKEMLQGALQLLYDGKEYSDFKVLNEQYLLLNQTIIPILSLGENVASAPYFNTRISQEDLPVYLSLFFSNLDHVNLIYEDFSVRKTEEWIRAEACLIFEKVDEDNALFMRVGQSLPSLPLNALEQFDLSRFVDIAEQERLITVFRVEQEALESIHEELRTMFKQQRLKSKRREEKAEVIEEGEFFILPKEIAAHFIYEDLPALIGRFQLFGAEKLKNYKVSTQLPSLIPSLDHGIDFLEGSIDLDFDGERIGLFDVIAQFRKQHYVQLADGTHALMNEAYIRRLERIFKKKGDKVQLSFFDLPLVEELIEEKTVAPFLQKTRAVFEGFNTLKERKMRLPKLNAKLRPYQKQGYKWLRYLQEQQLGGCLADDMGLGKTLQTIALMASAYPAEKKPSLIVMPRSLLFNWKKEVERFAPQLSTYTYYGQTRDIGEAQKANLTFTTYALMRNQIEVFRETPFYYVVLDESQNIKNVNAQTTKAAMLLQAQHRLALSGTPIENNLAELYSLFRFLNPAMFGSLGQFTKDYLKPIQKQKDKQALLELRKKIYPFVLRRLKKEVLKDLPDKIEQTLVVEMSAPQKKLYEERRLFYQQAIKAQIAAKGVQKAQFFIFQAFTELRQIASVPENISDYTISSTKRELLMEQLMDTIANGHKALIFVNFLTAIEVIAEQLTEAGVDFVSMTGATRDRQSLVQRFQSDDNCKVFLMTLKTGGTGLNLTAADTIFIYDPWWNAAAENQAIDRAHRIGQTNKVLAYKLIAEGSIEEKILQLQEVKKELFDQVISSDGASLKSLTEEDLAFILGS